MSPAIRSWQWWRSVVITGTNGLLGQHGYVLGTEIAPERSDITWQS